MHGATMKIAQTNLYRDYNFEILDYQSNKQILKKYDFT
jgi:hypothetical protein